MPGRSLVQLDLLSFLFFILTNQNLFIILFQCIHVRFPPGHRITLQIPNLTPRNNNHPIRIHIPTPILHIRIPPSRLINSHTPPFPYHRLPFRPSRRYMEVFLYPCTPIRIQPPTNRSKEVNHILHTPRIHNSRNHINNNRLIPWERLVLLSSERRPIVCQTSASLVCLLCLTGSTAHRITPDIMLIILHMDILYTHILMRTSINSIRTTEARACCRWALRT